MWLHLLLLLCASGLLALSNNDAIDYLAENLKVKYDVIDNMNIDDGFSAKVTLTNTGDRDIMEKDWELYFNNIRMIEPDKIHPNGIEFGSSGLMVHHVNGVLFKLVPKADFGGFKKSTPVEAVFTSSAWMVAYTDVMPNWYITAPEGTPKTIEATKGEELGFVGPINKEEQWKRSKLDQYDPYNNGDRISMKPVDHGEAPIPIIPTPYNMDLSKDTTVHINRDEWVVVKGNELDFETQYLSEKLGIDQVDKLPSGKSGIMLEVSDFVSGDPINSNMSGAYQMAIESSGISITGVDAAGVFYGVQSLVALYEGGDSSRIPTGTIIDFPRFEYRGQHIDIGRNFFGKDDLIRIVDAMSMYKLNKLHLHVTDDEGWRLEIPGLPELTEVASQRCHDMTGMNCIMPQLGSGPRDDTVGSGYLTVAQYKELLEHANDRHIEVIPEFDVPGHAHAAIHAMLARYHKYKEAGNMTAAEQYLLTDLNDTSEYLSVQYFTDNAINPCMQSTYDFMEHVITETIEMHKDIQPLKAFHFGGDEQPPGAWTASPKCDEMDIDTQYLKADFVYKLSEIVKRHGLEKIYGWEDGLMNGETPYNRSRIVNDHALAYFWDNVWEWGRGQRSYIMANAGFQVVLSHATHLYFDHPYEPDPNERGYYWATRIIPTQKTHSYAPDNIYENMLVDGNGSPINRDDICQKYGCVPLEEDAKHNIVGMQGQVWGETIRTSAQLDYMVFPRLLALAERAWHRADWEKLGEGIERDEARDEDWDNFANSLGYRELSRLDALGVSYRIPPPFASVEASGELEASTEHPGLPIDIKTDIDDTWVPYTKDMVLSPSVSTVFLKSKSTDGAREGLTVTLDVSISGSAHVTVSCVLLLLTSVLALLK
ncbi:hypothetical protein CAPTEDRAFT_219964 [Capitella teleta]|uniref:beta-N-acetylhexosaminidase n=1 Tax=Capitella teleta TaxID=283909 RepID=R7VE82_CAPTE|nr:hypothetical protein CAPTEDRAFT_219964 [Capitella teleta]|eukprot:ELU16939.1 hypothetical protein CAPTEDRAFT_219964 [Capitella teleta]